MPEDVHVSGPLFDGRAAMELRDGTDAVRRTLAREATRLALAAFAASIREQHSGKFMRSVTTVSSSRTFSSTSGKRSYTMPVVVDDIDTSVVTTSLATYGPWLEGSGSRNSPVTRFPGYHGFRRAYQELDLRAERVAEDALEPYSRRCN